MDVKFRPIHYNEPTVLDMAVVLVFFNPQRSIRVVQNIITVVHYLKSANIPYFIHELAFDDKPHLFAPAPNVKLSRSTSYMFYKENLIHTLLPSIPSKYTKFCIMDADIMFDNPDWYSIVSATLDSCDVCQPFTTTYFLGPNFKPIKQLTNCISSTAPRIDWMREHTGHIWAFRREWYETSGIPDVTVVGGGDFILTAILRKLKNYNNTYNLYKEYISRETINALVIYKSCDLNIYHLFHGLEVNRQYDSRIATITELFTSNDLTLKTVLSRRKDGILEWCSEHRDRINEFMKGYFARRNDDLVQPEFISTNKKFTPAPYISPQIRDMAIILVFFNPVKYVRIIQNILTIKHWLDQARIPYYIAEVAYDSESFLFKESDNVFQYITDSVLFHKENLVSIVEKKLPRVYTKFCMIDADILFLQPDWYNTISTTLDTVNVCQPFTNAIWLHADYTEFRRRSNCLDLSGSEIVWPKQHPGFIWAFNREWYCSFPYRNIRIPTIGGDTILHDLIKDRTTELHLYYKKYYDEIKALNIPIRYSSANLDILHLNHGTHLKRSYTTYLADAYRTIQSCGLSTFDDAVMLRDDGLLLWKPDCKDVMNRFNIDYFISRLEDEVE